MSTVNYPRTDQDITVRVFNNFYNFAVDVDQNDYDVVYSYFRSVFAEQLAAKNFTITLFEVAENTNRPVLDLLAEIKGQDQMQLTSTLAYYLNNLRSNSTLLGVSTPMTPNYYAARNVLP